MSGFHQVARKSVQIDKIRLDDLHGAVCHRISDLSPGLERVTTEVFALISNPASGNPNTISLIDIAEYLRRSCFTATTTEP